MLLRTWFILLALILCVSCTPSAPPTLTPEPKGVTFEGGNLSGQLIRNYWYVIPSIWRAASAKLARYTITPFRSTEVVENCDAKRAPFPKRLELSLKLTVVDKSTGKTIATETFKGIEPPSCEDNPLFPDLPSVKFDLQGKPLVSHAETPYVYIQGAPPSITQIENWIVEVLQDAELPPLTESDRRKIGIGILSDSFLQNFLNEGETLYTAIPENWKSSSHPRYILDIRQFGEVLEECRYGSGVAATLTLERIQVYNLVVIQDRQMDQMIDYRVFQGAAPDECPATAFTSRKSSTPNIMGKAPSTEEFRSWVQETMEDLPDLIAVK